MKTQSERLDAIEAEVRELRKGLKKGFCLDDLVSFEYACEIDGATPQEILPYQNPLNNRQEWINAVSMIEQIIKVAVQGWEPDYLNDDEYKYEPRFKLTRAGWVFDCAGYCCTSTDSAGGSRLVFPTAEMAELIGKRFIKIYNVILTKHKTINR